MRTQDDIFIYQKLLDRLDEGMVIKYSDIEYVKKFITVKDPGSIISIKILRILPVTLNTLHNFF